MVRFLSKNGTSWDSAVTRSSTHAVRSDRREKSLPFLTNSSAQCTVHLYSLIINYLMADFKHSQIDN